jgi:hypothetical protein
VGPRSNLDDVEKIKFLIRPGLELQPLWSSSPQLVAIRIALSWFPAINTGELCMILLPYSLKHDMIFFVLVV